MVIGIDASRANRKIKTGVEWYAYYLINAFKKLVVKDNIVLYSDRALRKDLLPLPACWQSKVLKWPIRKIWTLGRLSYEMLRRAPDLLFVPSHTLPLFLPKHSIITIHDIGFFRYPEFYTFFELFYHKLSVCLAIKRASKIIVPSEFTKKELISFYKLHPDKIVVTYHGIDTAKTVITTQIKNLVLQKYKLNKPYFFYIGRLEKKKNILRLIEAYNLLAKDLSDIDLVLVGCGSYGYEDIKDLIKKYNLNERVRVLGFVEQDEAEILFRSAAVFVFPSLYEGFGMPILEAMKYGVPVIASNIPACRETAGKAAIFIDPYDYISLSRAMKDLLSNNDLRGEMIKIGYQHVKQFSWEKCAQETYKVIKGVVYH